MLLLLKRFTRAHTRTLADGQVVQVAPHFDGRASAAAAPGVTIAPALAEALPGAHAAAQAIAHRFFPGHRLHLAVMPERAEASGLFSAPAFPALTYGATHYVPAGGGGGPDLLVQVATTAGGGPRQASELVWTLLHELGHAVQMARFEAAPLETRSAIVAQWEQEMRHAGPDLLRTPQARSYTLRWAIPGTKVREQIDKLPQEKVRADLTHSTAAVMQSPGGAHYHQFEEWFAERFATWASHNQAPRSAIERFFARSLEALRDAMRRALALLGQPTPTSGPFERWATETWKQAGGGGELRKAIYLMTRNPRGVVTKA